MKSSPSKHTATYRVWSGIFMRTLGSRDMLVCMTSSGHVIPDGKGCFVKIFVDVFVITFFNPFLSSSGCEKKEKLDRLAFSAIKYGLIFVYSVCATEQTIRYKTLLLKHFFICSVIRCLMEIRKDVVSLSDISLDSSGMHAHPAIRRSFFPATEKKRTERRDIFLC